LLDLSFISGLYLAYKWDGEPVRRLSKGSHLFYRGNKMGARVKPIQPTEIKNKKIALEAIEQIRKPIPASVYKRHEELAKCIDKMFKK